jgi:N utilization substance protein B
VTGSRRKARETVLQALYWAESSGDPVDQTLRTMSLRSDLSPEAARFATDLGRKAWADREALDGMIGRVAENWSVDRIARIDRILIRMALTEMRAFPDIPVTVSIDEAIELAKRFSVEKAPGFINGVLDRLSREPGLRKEA